MLSCCVQECGFEDLLGLSWSFWALVICRQCRSNSCFCWEPGATLAFLCKSRPFLMRYWVQLLLCDCSVDDDKIVFVFRAGVSSGWTFAASLVFCFLHLLCSVQSCFWSSWAWHLTISFILYWWHKVNILFRSFHFIFFAFSTPDASALVI